MANSATILRMRNDVLQLTPGSFGVSGYPTALFVPALMRGLANQAAKRRILGLLLTADECQQMGVPQLEILQQPPLPAANAVSAAFKVYDITNDRWAEQSKAIEELKSLAYDVGTITVKDRLDERVQGVNFGITRFTLLQLKTRILTLFGQASIQNVETYRTYLNYQWSPDTDFLEFLAHFNDIYQFLTSAGQPMSSGEAVLKLIDAVKHVPSFATATQLFFSQNPSPANQTLDKLMTSYREHYDTSYSDLSARALGMVNQASGNTSKSEAPFTTLLINEVRQHVGLIDVPPQMQQRVLAAVRSALQLASHDNATNTNRAATRKQSTPRDLQCPVHPKSPHTWQECRQNSKNAAEKSKEQPTK